MRASFENLQRNPASCAALLRALNDLLRPRTHAVVRCIGIDETTIWRDALVDAPRRTDIYLVPADASELPQTIAAQPYAKGGAAYICRGTQCLPAVATPMEALASLSV